MLRIIFLIQSLFFLKRNILMFILFFLPLCSYADILINNNTQFYGTAFLRNSLKTSPCSSTLGSDGVAKPHQSLRVPSTLIQSFCTILGCEAHIFSTSNCRRKIAIAKINRKGHITSLQNLDRNHFDIVGGGSYLTINQIKRFQS